MRFRGAFLATVTAVFAARAGILALNARTMPRLRPAPSRVGGQRVSILVPARDEERDLPGLLRSLAGQGAHEVIVCDDGRNGDGLAEAQQLGVRVIVAPTLPEGWVGKSWACWQLAQAATGDVLVFTDVGTRWRPGSLDAVLAAKEELGADLLSALPQVVLPNWRARLLTPLLENLVLGLVPWPLLGVDRLGKGVASGALIAVDREVYFRADGHHGIRGRILDDVELARAVQRTTFGRRRGRSRIALGDSMIGALMYRGYRESLRGFAKSLTAVHEGSRAATLLSTGLFIATHTVVWLMPPTRWVWVLRIAGLVDRSVAAAIAGRRRPADLAEGLLGPVTPLLAVPGVALGLRRDLDWKGRRYPASTARPTR